MKVFVGHCSEYDSAAIDQILLQWESLFRDYIRPGQSVVLKPNWIAHAHKYDENEWESVITHPAVITSVLKIILKHLKGHGRIVITDGPQTDASWNKIMRRMAPELWTKMGKQAGIEVKILDLREDEWTVKGDVNIYRKKLPGDPLGSTECDLKSFSEFVGHQPTRRGYYGADYNIQETNAVHSKGQHKYQVARTLISADIFINLPKMKTHKKAGITCSLKNLVGINTYKNWLPHYNEGTPDEGGDQFSETNMKNRLEGLLLKSFKNLLYSHQEIARWLIPVKAMGRSIFGDTQEVARGGNWYGNQTIWRMILDLNKVLLYANPDGSLKANLMTSRKKYLSIVDGIIAGEGNGPEAPQPKKAGLLVAGTNPVAIDAVCAKLMGFDWQKIPSIKNAFSIKDFPICDFGYQGITVVSTEKKFNKSLENIASSETFHFQPHFGWSGHIEL